MDPPPDPPSLDLHRLPPRRQQRKACDICRRRKVRCDIVDHPEGSCSVCRKLGVACRSTTRWAKPNRRSGIRRSLATPSSPTVLRSDVEAESCCDETLGSNNNHRNITEIPPGNPYQASPTAGASAAAAASSSSLSSPPFDGNAAPNDPAARREQLARNGLARFFKHGINAAAWAIFDSLDTLRIAYVGTAVSNLVHLVQLHRAFRRLPQSMRRDPTASTVLHPPTYDDHIGSDQETLGQELHYPYPPIRPSKEWKPGPEAFSGVTAVDLALDVSSFPTPEMRDALVAAYFEHVHPFHPVISMPEFLAAYRSPDKPPPLLLYQAVLMAGAHACSHPLVVRARHAVKTTLFRRASMLFHMRHETDRVHLMQAAVLFTRHVGDGDTVTGGPWYWSGIAVRIGCGLGMHRNSPTLPARETSQYRRCWWSAFICEVLASLETGRPCAVRAEDIDQLPMSEDDMTDLPGVQGATSSTDYRLRPYFLSRMVELAYIGLEILALNEPAQQRIIDVRTLDARLCQWSLQSGLPIESNDTDDNHEREEDPWAEQLRLHYNLMLLHLHRNFPDETNSQAVCSSAAQAIVGTLEKMVALDCLAQCHFSVISAVTAAGIHLAYEIRSAVAVRSFLVAIHALECLSKLLKPASLLGGYWPNAEAVHSVFQELYQEYKAYVSQGLQGDPVLIPEIQPDWYRLLAGSQLPQLNSVGDQDWLNIF